MNKRKFQILTEEVVKSCILYKTVDKFAFIEVET